MEWRDKTVKISTKGRYGLRTLIDLAAHDDEAPISLATIATRQGISLHYLEQVFAILRRAKVVKSMKGAQGGYKIGCNPELIHLKDILTLLEGDLSIVEYEEETDEKDKLKRCIQDVVWNPIDEKIESILMELTLQDMIEEYKGLKQGCPSKIYSLDF